MARKPARRPASDTPRIDVYQRVTDKIVAQVEAGARPPHRWPRRRRRSFTACSPDMSHPARPRGKGRGSRRSLRPEPWVALANRERHQPPPEAFSRHAGIEPAWRRSMWSLPAPWGPRALRLQMRTCARRTAFDRPASAGLFAAPCHPPCPEAQGSA